jgi:hypothetical protein
VDNKRFVFAFISILITTLACSIFIGGPAYPDSPIPGPATTEQDLQTYIQQAGAEGAQTGIITLQITENQLTSYLAFKLETQTNPIITEPRVILRDNQMKVFGKVQSGIFIANISITTQVSVDKNGQPKIEITQTDLGPLPAPQRLNDAVSAFVSEAFTGSFGPIATGFRLDNISIADGIMTVSGRVK